MLPLLRNSLSLVCLIAAGLTAQQATNLQAVLMPSANEEIMERGTIPVEYQSNQYGFAMSGVFLLLAGGLQIGVSARKRVSTAAQPAAQPVALPAPAVPPMAIPSPIPQPIAPIAEVAAVETAPQQTIEDAVAASKIIVVAEPEEKNAELWLPNFLFNEDGTIQHTNIKVEGPTGYGKTTLSENVMRFLGMGAAKVFPLVGRETLAEISAKAETSSIERWLINPKHIASKPAWSFAPYCSDIKLALKAVEEFEKFLRKRLHDPNFNPDTAHHRFYVVDEHDWIYEEYGAAYLSIMRTIVKVCRELNDHALIVGQSAQATNFNSSDYRQMGRLVLGSEALWFLESKQFPYRADVKQPLYERATRYKALKRRFCLAIPCEGMPELHLVPNLKKPVAVRAK